MFRCSMFLSGFILFLKWQISLKLKERDKFGGLLKKVYIQEWGLTTSLFWFMATIYGLSTLFTLHGLIEMVLKF